MDPLDPQKHQRGSGEKEHLHGEQEQQRHQSAGGQDSAEDAREKANKNNTHRNEQTGHAQADAEQTRKQAERAA